MFGLPFSSFHHFHFHTLLVSILSSSLWSNNFLAHLLGASLCSLCFQAQCFYATLYFRLSFTSSLPHPGQLIQVSTCFTSSTSGVWTPVVLSYFLPLLCPLSDKIQPVIDKINYIYNVSCLHQMRSQAIFKVIGIHYLHALPNLSPDWLSIQAECC